MKTPITKISPDGNEITHKSGNVYVAVKDGKCDRCVYLATHNCDNVPCGDTKNGWKSFKLKED